MQKKKTVAKSEFRCVGIQHFDFVSFDVLRLDSLEVLKLEQASEPPGKLVKTDCWFPRPEFLI